MPQHQGQQEANKELPTTHSQQDPASELHTTKIRQPSGPTSHRSARPPRTSSLPPAKRSTTPQHPVGDTPTYQGEELKLEGLDKVSESPAHTQYKLDQVPQLDIPILGSGSPLISDSIFSDTQVQKPPSWTVDGNENSSCTEPTPQNIHSRSAITEAQDNTAPDRKHPATATMHSSSRRDSISQRHARRRSSKGSNELDKNKGAKAPSQKAMLSRALQKANTAVQLDNAQNLEGARQAYSEACDLLQQVLKRTSTDEDKRKLEAIRKTYASRIEELDQMGPWPEEPSKALPARPESDDYKASPVSPRETGLNQPEQSRSEAKRDDQGSFTYQNRLSYSHQKTQSQESGRGNQENRSPQKAVNPAYIGSSSRIAASDRRISTSNDMPPPLTSFHQASPGPKIGKTRYIPHKNLTSTAAHRHLRDGSQNSWLDGTGDSGGSTNSSIHSRNSSIGYRRKHSRGASGNTEAEFDTALDAAIEAAYDDGYEPVGAEELRTEESNEEVVAKVLRKVEMAREKVRQSERETWHLTSGHHNQRQMYGDSQGGNLHTVRESAGFYDDNSSDEEERMLEEMARDYDIEDFTLRPQQIESETTAPDAKLKADVYLDGNDSYKTGQLQGALAEKPSFSNMNKNFGPAIPPPQQSLPELPLQRTTSPMQSVRNRRLSGQNPKQLKIETSKLGQAHHKQSSKSEENDGAGTHIAKLDSISQAFSPPALDTSRGDRHGSPSPSTSKALYDPDEFAPGRLASPSVDNLRHNFSSSSLRSLKSRNLSLSNIDDASDVSPGTPSSNQFGSLRTPAIPMLPTPLGSEFRDHMDGSAAGLHLFDSNLQLPTSPMSPADESSDAPVPLEPCPTDFMLRPFWLMRCLYQTIVHSRGGYVSTKLFVPRDVWRVKGVKLKNIDDKVANCDLLTAALLKLAQVDTCDADAVLEEMQSLEGILEQVQATLNRKLGSEVGVQGSGALFKEAPGAEGEGQTTMPRSASVSTKSSFSWRRLRSKNSAIGLNNRGTGSETPKDNAPLSSLPMTSQPTSRPAKRDLSLAQFIGPNASYMSSLARLFDAAQVIDQIARQVEDPGLRHADKTQVGLELCTRHAAEFFGFYICRFALSDLGILLEKFLKRGSEWALA